MGGRRKVVIVYIFFCVDNYPEINDAYLSFLSLFLLHLLHNAVRGAFLSFYTFLDCHDYFEAPGSNVFECVSFLFFFRWLLLVLSDA